MAADSTLVNAALKLGLARAGANTPNLKPLFDSNKQSSKAYLGMATNALAEYKVEKETQRLGKNAQLKGFKKILDDNWVKIVKRKQSMSQEVVNAVDTEVKKLQDEFEAVNTIGKGDSAENQKARTRITSELQMVIGEALDARETFQLLSENQDSWHVNAIKDEVIAPMAKMMDLGNIDTDVNTSVFFDENHKLTFNAKNYTQVDDGLGNMVDSGDVSYNLSQMRENLPTINAKKHSAYLSVLESSVKQAKLDAEDGGRPRINNEQLEADISALVDTKEDFRDLALTRIKGVNKESLVSALQNSDPAKGASIPLDLLESTFLTTFQLTDADRDGDIDLQDMNSLEEADKEIFKTNFNKMINVLTDVTDDDFDLDRSRKILINHLNNEVTGRYEYTFNGFEDAIMAKVSGNRKVGRLGWLTDPGTNLERYVGYKFNTGGSVQYDDNKIAGLIKAEKGFLDPFQNEYIPFYDRAGKFRGYEIEDGVTGLMITRDTEGVDGETIIGGRLIVSKSRAKRMTIGVGELN